MMIENGIYVLTEEVSNPRPDQRTRHHNPWDRPMFSEGMQFRIEVSPVDLEYFREILKETGVSEEDIQSRLAELSPTGFRVYPVSCSISSISLYIKFKYEGSKKNKDHEIWTALKPSLIPARRDTFGYLLHSTPCVGDQLSLLTLSLLYLLEEGKVSLEEVAESFLKANDTDEGAEQALYKRHKLV